VDLAHHFGISEARVYQVFRLLDLAPKVQEILVEIPDNLTYVAVGERDLRACLKLSEGEQVAHLPAILASGKTNETVQSPA
jgi:hypothetical protein